MTVHFTVIAGSDGQSFTKLAIPSAKAKDLHNENQNEFNMKTLVVFNHPHDGSFCNAILDAVQQGLKESGQTSGLIHLDHDGFDPVMRAKDLKAFALAGKGFPEALDDVDPLVKKYKTKLEQAEHLVLIFPIWWMNMPAMMKGFIDKVIFPAIAYDMKGGLLKSRLPIRKVTVISTMNTPADVYREHFNNAVEGKLINGTFRQIGIEEVEWISLSMVKQAPQEERELWLENIRIRFASAV